MVASYRAHLPIWKSKVDTIDWMVWTGHLSGPISPRIEPVRWIVWISMPIAQTHLMASLLICAKAGESGRINWNLNRERRLNNLIKILKK